MCLPQCERPKEDIICKSIRKGINVRDYIMTDILMLYYANCANKPGVEVHFLSGCHDDCGGVRLTVRSITSQVCILPELQRKVSLISPKSDNKCGKYRHRHHHLPPWIMSLDLFRHRSVAIVSWGVHDLFFF